MSTELNLPTLKSHAYCRRIARMGLEITPGLTQDAWSELIAELARLAGQTSHRRDMWVACLGDVLAYGNAKYRGQITEYAAAAGLSPGSLRDAKMVCLRIPLSCRRDNLSWSHHVEIGKAYENPVTISAWLDRAERERWSRGDLRSQIRAEKARCNQHAPQNESAKTGLLLLREFREAARLSKIHTATWRAWTPGMCATVVSEIPALFAFVDHIRANATGSRAKFGESFGVDPEQPEKNPPPIDDIA
jgi:hypothetical protein